MGLADLHIHSNYSWDSACTIPAILKYATEFTSLDVIAITDHDRIEGALDAEQLAPAYGVEVIPGIEISTAEGHLLALFVRTRIPACLSLEETIARVADQGGVCIAAHPMAKWAGALSAESIHRAVAHGNASKALVGIEVFNGGLIYSDSNSLAQALAKDLPLAQVGNSDAHVLGMVGIGASEFPGSSAADLRLALEQRTTEYREVSPWSGMKILRNWCTRMVLRRAGWIAWNEDPAAPIRISSYRRVFAAVQPPKA